MHLPEKKRGWKLPTGFFLAQYRKPCVSTAHSYCMQNRFETNKFVVLFIIAYIRSDDVFVFCFYRKRNVRRNRVCDGMKTGRDIALGHFTRGEGVFWKSPPPRVSQSDWTFSIGKNIKNKTGFSTNTVLHYNISCRLIKLAFLYTYR